MFKKVLLLLLMLLLSPIIGGLYGILHDQVTYTISPEYYTKFKFYQFGIYDIFIGDPRLGAVYVGFMATWWMGLPIGLVLGLVSLLFPLRLMLRYWLKAIGATVSVTILVPFVAVVLWLLLYRFHPYELSPNALPRFVPQHETVTDLKAFFTVGTIHNFSYLGGLVGLVAGVIYLVIQYRKLRKQTA